MRDVFAVLESAETLLEIAHFYRELSQRIPGEVSKGDDARQLARVLGIKVPAVLEGAAIQPVPDDEHEKDPRPRIVIKFPEENLCDHGPVGTAERGKGGGSSKQCWENCWGALVGKVCLKVCADCTLKGAKVSCTVTLTVSASIF
ncbi:hypothetical protein ACNHKD_07675 [Methylocystis sp. JAN1]|uniref:hypothetical protein n=1 Tax=Methylocystis sp. JAN1 TaxID=3397211 RepID=UPI003FA1F07B